MRYVLVLVHLKVQNTLLNILAFDWRYAPILASCNRTMQAKNDPPLWFFYVINNSLMFSLLFLCYLCFFLCRLCSFNVVFTLLVSFFLFWCRLCSFYVVFALFMSSLLFWCRLCSFYVVFALFMTTFLFYVVFAFNFSRLCSF